MVIYKRQGAIKKVQSQHNISKLWPEKKLKISFAGILVFSFLLVDDTCWSILLQLDKGKNEWKVVLFPLLLSNFAISIRYMPTALYF